MQKVQGTKSWISEKINKMDKPLSGLIRENTKTKQNKTKKPRAPINIIRNQTREVTTDTTGM